MSEAICTKPQEEYEDDFEKDLDWLISEEGRSEDQVNEASVHVDLHASPPSLLSGALHCCTLQCNLECSSSCSPLLLCESVVASVELRELACLCVSHVKPTLLTHSGVVSPVRLCMQY